VCQNAALRPWFALWHQVLIAPPLEVPGDVPFLNLPKFSPNLPVGWELGAASPRQDRRWIGKERPSYCEDSVGLPGEGHCPQQYQKRRLGRSRVRRSRKEARLVVCSFSAAIAVLASLQAGELSWHFVSEILNFCFLLNRFSAHLFARRFVNSSTIYARLPDLKSHLSPS
jgi:hypothetical protein